MLIHAAVCPHPPLLVPELAGQAASELDALRAACRTAVTRLGAAVRTAEGRAVIVVVGGDVVTRSYGPDAVATLRPYGLVRSVDNGGTENDNSGTESTADPDFGRHITGCEVLPLSLTIGRWLLRDLLAELPDDVPVRFHSIAHDAAPDACLRLGRELAGAASEPTAFLVMGDGSACLTERAPGYRDPRAEPYDTAVAKALAQADTAALADLDPAVSREIQAAGRAPWQVLAGAATAPPGDRPGAAFDAELLAYEAPYGVGYFVASWNGLTAP